MSFSCFTFDPDRRGGLMMDFNNEVFSLKQVRELDLVFFLQKLGYEPTARKKNDTDYWYLSPLRDERTASFHVNRLTNEWYDFGLAAGGNPVDFCLRFFRCSIPEVLKNLKTDFSPHQLNFSVPGAGLDRVKEREDLIVKTVRPLYAYALKNYLHDRSIPVAVADTFCKEVSYEIGGRSYYGIGFQNDMGGWEIRNKNFKQSSSPKDITSLASGAAVAHVFEGFMDFLSYRVLHPYEDPGLADYIVLNGAGLFDRAVPFLTQHEQVHLWLDRDVTGLAYTKYALSLGQQFRDESGFYSKFKDLNEWLQCKGEVRKPVLRQQTGLRPTA